MKVAVVVVTLLGVLLIGYRWGVTTINYYIMESSQREMDKYIAIRAADTIRALNEMRESGSHSIALQCQMKKLVLIRSEDWQKCTGYEACKSDLKGFFSEVDGVVESFRNIECH